MSDEMNRFWGDTDTPQSTMNSVKYLDREQNLLSRSAIHIGTVCD